MKSFSKNATLLLSCLILNSITSIFIYTYLLAYIWHKNWYTNWYTTRKKMHEMKVMKIINHYILIDLKIKTQYIR